MESIPGLLKNVKIPSLAGRFDNPVPTRFLAPIDCYTIPAKKLSSLLFTGFMVSHQTELKIESRRSFVVIQGDDSLVFYCGVHTLYNVQYILCCPHRKKKKEPKFVTLNL